MSKTDEFPEEDYWKLPIPKPETIIEKAQAFISKYTTKCPHCGKRIDPDFNVCPYCNKKIRKTPSEIPSVKVHCSNCGKPISPDYKICPFCGDPVEIPKPEATTEKQVAISKPLPAKTEDTYTCEQAMEEFKILKKQYLDATLSKDSFKSSLTQFRFSDKEGVHWTIGAQSEKWYRNEGGNWVQGTPKEPLLKL